MQKDGHMCTFINMSVTVNIYLFSCSCTLPWCSSYAWSITTNAGVIFHTDSTDGRASLSPRWLKQRERVSHIHAVWIHRWVHFWPLKRKCLQAGRVLLYRISAARTHRPHSHFWQESLRSDVTHQLLAVEAKFCYSLTMNVELFPRRLFFPLSLSRSVLQSLMCAGILESTLFYWNSRTVKIRSHKLNPTWQLWWFMSHKSLVHELYHPVEISLFLLKSVTTRWAAESLCPGTKGQVRRKREQQMGRCLPSRLFPQRSEYFLH